MRRPAGGCELATIDAPQWGILSEVLTDEGHLKGRIGLDEVGHEVMRERQRNDAMQQGTPTLYGLWCVASLIDGLEEQNVLLLPQRGLLAVTPPQRLRHACCRLEANSGSEAASYPRKRADNASSRSISPVSRTAAMPPVSTAQRCRVL